MAYTFHTDTNQKVGFRPYGQTNPRRAANLSGFGDLGQNRPFDPWELHQENLHGLGQYHPFDQDPGGWVLHGLGAVSDAEMKSAIAAGQDAAMLQRFSDLGATDSDIEELLLGMTTESELLARLYAGIPAGPGDSSTAPVPDWHPPMTLPGSVANVGNPSAQVPSGSTLLYRVSYSENISTPSPNDAMTALAGQLPAYNMHVVGSKLVSNTYLGFGTATIEFTVYDDIGHALKSDAQSVLDALMDGITYHSRTGSQLDILATPAQPLPSGGTGVPSKTDWPTWFQNNWELLAAAGLALVVAGPVARGLFGGRR